MREAIAHQILERLCNIEAAIEALAKHNATKHAHTAKLVKEVYRDMATKEELNTALDGIATEVTKLGDDLAARLAELAAQIAAGTDVTDSLAKANAIATKLQSIDETLPERPTT